MILKRICCLAAALAIVVPSFAGINRNEVKEIADRVADWQIANFKNVSYTGKKRAPLDLSHLGAPRDITWLATFRHAILFGAGASAFETEKVLERFGIDVIGFDIQVHARGMRHLLHFDM